MFKQFVLGFMMLNLMIVNSFAKERKKIDEKSKMEIISVLEANEELFNAFFEYDAKKVEESALKLKDTMGKVSNPEINKLLDFSIKKLDEVKASASREDNNQAYHLISMALIHIVGTYAVGDVYNAYSCPMVKKKWVQNSKTMKEVHNPYAPGMPHCGSQDTKH